MEAIIQANEGRRTDIRSGRGNPQHALHALAAIDHYASYYASWPREHREAERKKWLELVTELNLLDSTKKPKPSRKKPDVCNFALPAPLAGQEQRFAQLAHCCNEKGEGVKLRRMQWAWKKKRIQINPLNQVNFLVFDCDHSDVDRWQKAKLPPPTWIAMSPDTRRHHVVYALRAGVCKSFKGRPGPLRYLAAIEEAYRYALGGDRGYRNNLTKNPLHSAWKTLYGDPCSGMALYELKELASCVRLPKQPKPRPPEEASGVGRNCTLFEELRQLAYTKVSAFECDWAFKEAVRDWANQLNIFEAPLSSNEVKSIATSVSRWIWQRRNEFKMNSDQFILRQRARGKESGKARQKAYLDNWTWVSGLSDCGWTISEIASHLHLPRATVGRWVKKWKQASGENKEIVSRTNIR